MPADLAVQSNGRLPDGLLTSVDGGGRLHHLAARAWSALVADAWASVGLPLTYTYGGTYRPYSAQETLFMSRYSPSGTGGGCKTWNGVRWCKKSANLATAAVPGTSNHGWGLAIDSAWDKDLSDGLGPDDAVGITSHPGWSWLLANAERFGFSWELQSEPWHLRYVAGDAVPAAVLAFEQPTPAPPPPPPPPSGRMVDMFFVIVTNGPNSPVRETWLLCDGTQLSHVVDGHAAALIGRVPGVDAVRPASAEETAGLIRSCKTMNDCPPEWQGTGWEIAWNGSR
jgi:hypothetical protein